MAPQICFSDEIYTIYHFWKSLQFFIKVISYEQKFLKISINILLGNHYQSFHKKYLGYYFISYEPF